MEDVNTLGQLDSNELYHVVEEFRLSSPAEVRKVRQPGSLFGQAGITVQPADIGARDSMTIKGVSRELASERLLCTCDLPVPVGSIFYLSFDRSVVDVDSVLGVCDRCIMLGPTAFEVGFRFVQDMELPESCDSSMGPESGEVPAGIRQRVERRR